MKLIIATIASILALSTCAHAQNPVQQSGTVTKGHVAKWNAQGTVQDAGPWSGGNANVGITDLPIVNTGTPLCIYDAPITNSLGYHSMCFGAAASGGTNSIISVNSGGAASPLPLVINVNGVDYPFPGAGNGNAIMPTAPAIGIGNITLGNGGTNLRDGVNSGDPLMQAFTPPNFGGTWLSGSFLGTTGTAGHGADARTSLNINRTSIGSGINGPANADYSLFVTAQKTNFLSSGVDGEISSILVVTGQGILGDADGYLGTVQKVRGGSGGAIGQELSSRWINNVGDIILDIHALGAFLPSAGEMSNNTGYGLYAENFGASVAAAASFINPYSGVMVQDFDVNSNCPAHCSQFQYAFTGSSYRSASQLAAYFQIGAGPTATGDIMQGSGGPDLFGTPTQSLGIRTYTKNIGGVWTLVANDNTTKFKEISQSITAGSVIERLTGPAPVDTYHDTNTAVNAGGLQRLAFFGGTGVWQINTAVAGDFSTKNTAFTIYPSGGFSVGIAGDSGAPGTINATAYKAGGVAGVTCAPGAPTPAFAVANGIVIAC